MPIKSGSSPRCVSALIDGAPSTLSLASSRSFENGVVYVNYNRTRDGSAATQRVAAV
jgi:hypothetical protein